MPRFKVMMTDCIFPDQDVERAELASIDAELVLAPDTNPATFIELGRDCDAVLNVYAQLPPEVILALEKCRVIARTGIGVNTIDLNAANQRGIMVANVPDYCLDEVADHAMALFLALARKIVPLGQGVKDARWSFGDCKPIDRIAGRTFGIYGFGAIARRVARRAKSFDLRVLAFDPYVPADVFAAAGVEQAASLDELLAQSDYLTLHAPLTPETTRVMNAAAFARMKNSAIIINTSRGPLIDEDDLFVALSEGALGGAGLDVLTDEPPQLPSRLAALDNVIITPHAAFYSEESMVELRRKSVGEIIHALTAGAPLHWVNRPAGS